MKKTKLKPCGKRGNKLKSLDAKWSKAIMLRDDGMCALCKNTAIHSHHIYGKKANPVWRHELWNGVALCPICHKFVHDYPNAGLVDICLCIPEEQVDKLQQFTMIAYRKVPHQRKEV